MNLKYYSLDDVTVLSVPGVAQTFMVIKKAYMLHSATETLTDQTDRHCNRFD